MENLARLQANGQQPQQQFDRAPRVIERRCNRCSVATTPRGGISATIAGADGLLRRKFICRDCVNELRGACAALVAPAEYAAKVEASAMRRAT